MSKFLTIQPVQTCVGSDLKIFVDQFTWYTGEPISFESIYLDILWRDCGGKEYRTVWNPRGASMNIIHKGDRLAILFDSTKYQFRYPGPVEYKIDFKVYDSLSPEGVVGVQTDFEKSGITLL